MSYRYPAALALSLILAACRPVPDDTSDDTSGDDTSGDDTGGDDTGDTDTEVPVDCYTLPATLPAWAGDIDPTLVTNTPYTTIATGLADLVDAIAALPSNTDPEVPPDTLTSPITVTDAYVLTTGFKPQSATNEVNFWVADQNDVAYVRLAVAASVVVAAGDKVTFTATKGQNFDGDIQVAEITGFSVTSSDNDVYVKESTGQTLGAADFFWVHHLYGELIDAGVTGGSCGGSSTCFTYRHGSATGPTNTLRIRNDNVVPPLEQGNCIEVYMPADQHDGAISFDVTDFKWHRWYGN